MPNFQDCVQFILDNKLDGYTVRKGSSDNDMVFRYDPDASPENNLERLTKIMAYTPGRFFKLKGWKGANQNRGTFTFDFDNETTGVGSTEPASAQPQTQVINKGYTDEQVKRLVDGAVEKATLQFKLQDLERREKQLADERKEFLSERDSVLGVLVKKAAPMISGFLSSKMGARQPVQTIGTADAGEDPEQPVPVAEEATEEETQHIEDLLNRWAAVEPVFVTLLEKIVSMAEAGDRKYNLAKQMLT